MSHKTNKNQEELDHIKTVNRSLELLKQGNLNEALALFSDILKTHFSDTVAESGIKSCKYWMTRLHKLENMKDGYEKGKSFIDEWKKFETFISSMKNFQKKVTSSLMYFIFNRALESFKKDLVENKVIDIQTSFIIGLCYKKIGDYKNAIKYFEDTIANDHNNSNAMAEIADCYALIDETKKAKILFRESFFLDPVIIESNNLEADMLKTIISKIEEEKIESNEINHWIPIYGRILGIFNIYRELLPIELGKLKQEIFYLEKNYDNFVNDSFYKPRLLNCYLWLYDYHLLKNSTKEILQEIENKVKTISETIYNYLKNNNYQGD